MSDNRDLENLYRQTIIPALMTPQVSAAITDVFKLVAAQQERLNRRRLD